ncbi:MAG: hypothetical protein ACJ786_27910 [Catenulispora sp.]
MVMRMRPADLATGAGTPLFSAVAHPGPRPLAAQLTDPKLVF